MTPPEPAGPPAEPGALTEGSEKNLAALRRAMARAKSLSLLFVISDGPARAEVGRRLRAWSGKDGFPELRFFADGAAGAAEMEAFLAEAREEPVGGAVVMDGDALVAREKPVLSLNMARDRLGKLIAGPLVIVLAPRREAEFAGMAPDLFDVRSASYEVEAEPGVEEEALMPGAVMAEMEAMKVSPARRAPLSAEQLRALEASPEPPPLSALADEWLRLSDDLVPTGHWKEVFEAVESALRLARSAGYRARVRAALTQKALVLRIAGRASDAEQTLLEALELAEDSRTRADVQSELSRTLSQTGRQEEALRLLREEVLPEYEASGDRNKYAVHLLRASEVLIGLGRYDNAARMLDEEILPLCAETEDPLLKAKVTGQLAQIDAARGRLDTAISLLREQVIPRFEQAGEKGMAGIYQFLMARYLVEKNGEGDREEARRLYMRTLRNSDGVLRLPGAAGFRQVLEEQLRALS